MHVECADVRTTLRCTSPHVPGVQGAAGTQKDLRWACEPPRAHPGKAVEEAAGGRSVEEGHGRVHNLRREAGPGHQRAMQSFMGPRHCL